MTGLHAIHMIIGSDHGGHALVGVARIITPEYFEPDRESAGSTGTSWTSSDFPVPAAVF